MSQPAHGLRWRVGHIVRRIPEGYLETLARGGNAIHDEGLAAAYETLRTVVRGPLLAGERWRALWRLWTGAHRDDLARFAAGDYATPPRLPATAAQLEGSLPPGTFWFDEPRVRLVYHGGLEVALVKPSAARELRVMLHGGPVYTLRFRRAGEQVGIARVDCSQQDWLLGLQPHRVEVPAGAQPFDVLWIDAPTDSEKVAALGALELVP
jgi:arabinofuranosyltransferase